MSCNVKKFLLKKVAERQKALKRVKKTIEADKYKIYVILFGPKINEGGKTWPNSEQDCGSVTNPEVSSSLEGNLRGALKKAAQKFSQLYPGQTPRISVVYFLHPDFHPDLAIPKEIYEPAWAKVLKELGFTPDK